MKVITSNENINSLGGLNFISSEFDNLGMPSLVKSTLYKRSLLATYGFSDIVKSICMLSFAGGDCAEDIQANLKKELSIVLYQSAALPRINHTN